MNLTTVRDFTGTVKNMLDKLLKWADGSAISVIPKLLASL